MGSCVMILVDGLIVPSGCCQQVDPCGSGVAHRPARDWSVVSEDYLLRDWSRRKLAVVADDSVEPHRRTHPPPQLGGRGGPGQLQHLYRAAVGDA
ncbi:MAG TPA: hypothetical protein VJ625_00840 [Propionibacteriaceae bacterium]|nr:hypothetical protein [Propionibacteriaceae bacterium]